MQFARFLPTAAPLAVALACSTDGYPDGETLPVRLVPQPDAVYPSESDHADSILVLGPAARIASTDFPAEAELLAAALGPAFDFDFPVVDTATDGDIELRLDSGIPPEGYRLSIDEEGVAIVASDGAGAFYGTQTLRQLFDPASLSADGKAEPALPWVEIEDSPRFLWRGVMIDVARHFFDVQEIERLIDLAVLHKLNRLHLHLTDDQGWRIEILSWPLLAEIGGASEVGGGEGGFYTQAEYAGLVAYAAARHMLVVPEIDLPGHANAALSAYPELNSSGEAAEPWLESAQVDAALCLDCPATAAFVEEVIGEVAALSPGGIVHVGADEVTEIEAADYAVFVQGLQTTVNATGASLAGWDEIGTVELQPPFYAQHWTEADRAVLSAAQGARVIESPGEHAYLDMVYDGDAEYGQIWAGAVNVEASYDWDPVPEGLAEDQVAGVEGALWTEYIDDREKIDFMVWPRLAALAEVGWTSERDWEDFALRIGWHGARLEALGIGYYASPELEWTSLAESGG